MEAVIVAARSSSVRIIFTRKVCKVQYSLDRVVRAPLSRRMSWQLGYLFQGFLPKLLPKPLKQMPCQDTGR